jgi:hypothetical protein
VIAKGESVSPAERMRRLRARRRNGIRSLRVMLHDMEIDCLVTKGFLKSDRRRHHAAIQSAIDDFIATRPSGSGASRLSETRERPQALHVTAALPAKGGPLHVTAPLHVTGSSRSWRIGAPLQMRHAPHATHVSNGAPGLKSQ